MKRNSVDSLRVQKRPQTSAGKSKTLKRFIGLVFACTLCQPGNADQYLVPPAWFDEPGPVLSMDYGRTPLSGAAMRTARERAGAALLRQSPKHGWPEVIVTEDRACLISVPAFFHRHEHGLRIEVCHARFRHVAGEINSAVFEAIAFSHDSTARPFWKARSITIQVANGRATRRILEDARLLYDAAPGDRHSLRELLGSRSSFAYEPDSVASLLARRFPLVYASVLASASEAFWVYPHPIVDEWLIVTFSDRAMAAEIGDAFQRLEQVAQAVHSQTPSSARVTEMRFAARTGSGTDMIQWETGASDGIVALQFQTDRDFLVDDTRFAFANSAFLYSKRTHAAFGVTREWQSESSFDLAALSNLALPDRSIVRSTTHATWKPATRCWSGPLCGSDGIPPSLLAALQQDTIARPPGACLPSDFRLTEFNPSGIDRGQGRREPSGKFIEIVVGRDCQVSQLFLETNGLLFGIPDGRFAKNETITLYAGDQHWFIGDERQSVIDRRIAAISPAFAIRIVSLPHADSHLLRGANANIDYLNGGGHSDLPLHSLVYDASGSEYFSNVSGQRLRPDLREKNKMHPGEVVPIRLFNSTGLIEEILSVGSRDADSTYPGDEFIELTLSPPHSQATATLLRLEIDDESETTSYRFPAFAVSRATIFRDMPNCFVQGPTDLFASQLRLPNQSATYTLRDEFNTELDRLGISATLLALLDQDVRRSVTRFPGGFRPSDGDPSLLNLCGPHTAASPGAPASFRPFVHLEQTSGFDVNATLFGEENQTNVEWDLRFTDAPFASGQVFATRGISFAISVPLAATPGREFRLLIDAQPIGGSKTQLALYDKAALTIAAVSPTPATGRVEWLRLCSPHGFNAADSGSSIIVRDSFGADEIVPFRSRSGGPLPLPFTNDDLSLVAGQCAILVDPDYGGHPLPLTLRDVKLWTIAGSSAIGNGLSSGEPLQIEAQQASGETFILATYGAPDLIHAFGIATGRGEYVRRKANLTTVDRVDAFEVIR